MDENHFQQLVQKGIANLEEDIRKSMDNVSIVVQDFPTREQIHQMKIKHGHLLLGLYEGIPPARRLNYSGVLPDKITIFKGPLLMIAKSEDHLAKLVEDTVWHEVAHHHGMNEEEVRRAEKIRAQIRYKESINN